jgi:aminobenzoyl-glutamate transport protein
MSAAAPSAPAADASESRTFVQKMLDGIEKAGNKVPHPVMMFLYLILLVIVLSAVLDLLNVSVTEEVLIPVTEIEDPSLSVTGGSTEIITLPGESGEDIYFIVEEQTTSIRSLLSISGIRFIFSSFVSNFASFSVVAVIFVAMIGIGVAEKAGLMGALIRKLVAVTPASMLTFSIVLIGGLSSIASDAGYLILVPLGGAAFLSVGRHPLVGIAAAYAGVSAAFSVNVLIAPLDAMLTEMTNEAIALETPGETISITANMFFETASMLVMALVITLVTERIIEPRLGKYDPSQAGDVDESAEPEADVDLAAEGRGLRYAGFAVLGFIALIVLLTAPPGAPLRDPDTGAIVGNTPFMDSLIFMITMLFLAAGVGYGIGARTFKNSTDAINGVTTAFAGLSGLIFMLLIISQFIAYFNFSNLPTVIAGGMAHLLESANVHELILLIGLILIIAVLDIIIPGSMPKWAIFAPIFIPLFIRLGVAPQTVLAAYRVGDSPMNVVTPLMVYLPFIVIVSQRYVKDTGLGTIVSLMIPYTLIVLAIWIVFFVIWYALGIPLGPGYGVGT